MYQSVPLSGSHQFLAGCPIIADVLIYAFLYSLLWLGRWLFEGKGYDVAYSSRYGDLCLAAFIIIAATIITGPNFHPTESMENDDLHRGLACFSLLIGILYTAQTKPKYEMDRWHGMIIVPLFIYLIATTLPVYWYFGTTTQKIIGLVLILIWIALVIIDGKTSRLNQRKWIAKNHPDWKFKK